MKRFLSVILGAVIALTAAMIPVSAQEAQMPNCPCDIYTHWAQDNIYTLVYNGILNGYEDQTFLPDNSISRAEFCKMIIGALVKQGKIELTDETGTFKDVAPGEWFTPYIETAAAMKIVGGTGGGYFEPDAEMEREQMAKIIAGVYCSFKEVSMEAAASPEDSYKTFSDFQEISDWAKPYVSAVYNQKLMNGDEGRFLPLGKTTRAEAATVIFRLFGYETVAAPYNKCITLDSFLTSWNAVGFDQSPYIPEFQVLYFDGGDEAVDYFVYEDMTVFVEFDIYEEEGVTYVYDVVVTVLPNSSDGNYNPAIVSVLSNAMAKMNYSTELAQTVINDEFDIDNISYANYEFAKTSRRYLTNNSVFFLDVLEGMENELSFEMRNFA